MLTYANFSPQVCPQPATILLPPFPPNFCVVFFFKNFTRRKWSNALFDTPPNMKLPESLFTPTFQWGILNAHGRREGQLKLMQCIVNMHLTMKIGVSTSKCCNQPPKKRCTSPSQEMPFSPHTGIGKHLPNYYLNNHNPSLCCPQVISLLFFFYSFHSIIRS